MAPRAAITLAIGHAVGRIRLGGVTLGAVVGVLIAGVIIGQLGVKVSGDLMTGAATSAPSLAAVQEVAKSKIPTEAESEPTPFDSAAMGVSR